MKRALIITTISGFLAQFEWGDVKILQGLGYEVHYASNFNNPVYPAKEGELMGAGIRLHHIDIQKSPLKVGANRKAFLQLRQILQSEQIDLVHCHNPVGAAVARLAVQSLPRRPYVIYTAHGLHFYKGAPLRNWLFYYSAEALLAHWTDMLVTINEEDRLRATKLRLRGGGVVGKIPGVGVDMERFCPRPEIREKIRREMGIPEGAFHIVTAAELNKNKNQKMVIEALAGLGISDIYYSICGQGPKEQELRNQIRHHGLEDHVFLWGYRTDMERVLQGADCFVFPSYREGLGIAAVEALAVGIPLIVADNRGTREYAFDGKNAVVCQSQTVSEYVGAIKKIYEDRVFREKLSMASRESARPFGMECSAAVMRKLYGEADRSILRKDTTFG